MINNKSLQCGNIFIKCIIGLFIEKTSVKQESISKWAHIFQTRCTLRCSPHPWCWHLMAKSRIRSSFQMTWPEAELGHLFRWPVPSDEVYGIPLHHISFTYSRMHIYQGPPTSNWHEVYLSDKLSPLLQLTIDLWNTTTAKEILISPSSNLTKDVWNTTTLNKFHIEQNAHILRADVSPLQLTIDLWKYHYTK